jgi:hypothetical protein
MELNLHSPLGLRLQYVLFNEAQGKLCFTFFHLVYACAKKITNGVNMKKHDMFSLTSKQFRLTSYPNNYHTVLPHQVDILVCCAYQGVLTKVIYYYRAGCCKFSRQNEYKVFRTGSAIAQAVSRRHPTAAARIQTQFWSCGIL